MLVLVACEFTGVVRDAFAAQGHDAWSCDIEPSEVPGPHYQGDVRDILDWGWDLMIAHPPCTHLANSGRRWFKEKQADGRQQEALDFVQLLLDAPIEKIALENPMGIIGTSLGRPCTQTVQPWWFGDDASKATCLWLKGLPKLEATDLLIKHRYANQYESGKSRDMGPRATRAKDRSRTFPGLAQAMAEQWGAPPRIEPALPPPPPGMLVTEADQQPGESLEQWLSRMRTAITSRVP